MNLRLYYANWKVQNKLIEISKNREVSVMLKESFGKRPDILMYPSDVMELAKSGATSFHISEEHWKNPLLLKPGMTKKELDDLRTGWDLIMDIDGPFELSKITAYLITEALEFNDVKNYTIKFSGNKGFHIGIPFNAFPEKVHGIETKNLFPEGPKMIVSYLNHIIEDEKRLSKMILEKYSIEEISNLSKKEKEDITYKICSKCKLEAKEEKETEYKCECGVTTSSSKNFRCPKCKKYTNIEEEKRTIECPNCGQKDKSKFEEGKFNPFSVVGVDAILISNRHMFRAPYSYHEKSGLISIPITKNQILNFDKENAKPENVKFDIPFLSKCEDGEASRLIIQAFDWNQENTNYEKKVEVKIYDEFSRKVPQEFFPDSIKKGLLGLKDGRKRFLFILLNFLRHLNYNYDEIKGIIEEWNKKNDEPLKEGYINSQLLWHKRQKKVLPPNFTNKSYYQDIGLNISERELKFKNPVNFAVKMFKLKHH